MYTIREGEKKDVAVKIERTRGSGAITATSPERRILTAARVLVIGYDWGAALFDDANDELYMLFDSTVAALATPGTYYVQLRCVIDTERYLAPDVVVRVIDAGP